MTYELAKMLPPVASEEVSRYRFQKNDFDARDAASRFLRQQGENGVFLLMRDGKIVDTFRVTPGAVRVDGKRAGESGVCCDVCREKYTSTGQGD